MKIFVSSSYTNHPQVAKFQDRLREIGHTITEDWAAPDMVDEEEANGLAEYMARGIEPPEDHPAFACAQDRAQRDIDGVRECDVLVLLQVPKMQGAYIECGAALVLGKRVIFVTRDGDRIPIFRYLEGAERVRTEDEALELLRETADV